MAALFLGLGVLAAVVFCTGLCIAVIKLRCPACGGSVYHQAMRAQEGVPFALPKLRPELEMNEMKNEKRRPKDQAGAATA